MSFVDQLFGNMPDVLTNRSKRLQLISSNLANADTPGYKARDIDFESVYAQKKSELELHSSNSSHMNASGASVQINDQLNSNSLDSLYRVPNQHRIDGNTVETDVERMEFMENAIRYQATLGFMDRKVKSYIAVLRGE